MQRYFFKCENACYYVSVHHVPPRKVRGGALCIIHIVLLAYYYAQYAREK
jgi:hypothetical protein